MNQVNASDLIKGKKLYVAHDKSKKPILARNYLLEIGAPKSKVDRLFDNTGNFIYSVDDNIDPYKLSTKSLQDKLLGICTPVYDLVNPSLDGNYDVGFNKHGRGHVAEVTKVALCLLKEAKCPNNSLVIAATASVAHDLGNLLSRPYHPKLSVKLFKMILPNYHLRKEDWEKVEFTIENHEKSSAIKLIGDYTKLSAITVVENARNKLSKETLAIIIADKTRVGRDRISDKPRSSDALDIDTHIEVELLGHTVDLIPKEDSFTWIMHYHPRATRKEISEKPHFFRPRSFHGGYKAAVSSETQEQYQLKIPVDHFSRWRQKFWNIYLDRNILAVICAFALFPKLELFNIKMIDLIAAKGNSFESTTYNIYKDELDRYIKFLELKYLPKKVRRKNGKA